MRKIPAFALFLCLIPALSACGGGSPEQSQPPSPPAEQSQSESPAQESPAAAALPDAQTAAQAYLDGEVFSEELEPLDLDVAYNLYGMEGYGIAREDLLDGAVYLSAGATAEEASVLEMKDEDTAALAVSALTDHVAAQMDSYRDYIPEEIPKLENALVQSYGSTVVLVVPADAGAAETVTRAQFPAD